MDPFEQLASAIILQAVEDWRHATQYWQHGKQKVRLELARECQKECEAFFLSEWFTVLTDLDGPSLLKRLKKEG